MSEAQKEEEKNIDEMPSSSRDLSKSLPEEAFNNFLQGKRHMLVQDYTFAVLSLADACELYVKHFGDLALECGEVYFLYGKALFRLSQQQSGVLGNVLNEGKNDEDDEEEDEKSSGEEEGKEIESDKNASDAEGSEEEPEVGPEEKEPSEPTDSPDATEDGAIAPKEEKEPEKPEAEVPETSEKKESEEEVEDDLELAWNTLETAKTIFKKQGESKVDAQLKVAEILQLLAEISMESDNNAAAIADLKECLEIQKKYLSPDDRILAETYYQMGLAHMLEKQYSEALGHFKMTMGIIELRIENLKKQTVPDTVGSFDVADQAIEISNLEGILPDIKEKIEDTEELIRNAKKEFEEAFIKNQEAPSSSSLVSKSSNGKPISNITHLLKRKKPNQEGGEEGNTKRLKLGPLSNGDSSTTQESTSKSTV